MNQNYILCVLWQYGFWSFQTGDTKDFCLMKICISNMIGAQSCNILKYFWVVTLSTYLKVFLTLTKKGPQRGEKKVHTNMDNFRFWLFEKSDQHTAEVFPFLFILISSSYSFLYFMAPSIFFPYPLKKNKKMIPKVWVWVEVFLSNTQLWIPKFPH